MQVYIASVSDATDVKGDVFKVFNIYLNGIYHCSLRYSQLRDLHNELKKQFDLSNAVPFPTKRLRINAEQLEERRIQLEGYLHSLLHHPEIGASGYFLEFMLVAQQVSSGVADISVDFSVHLCNGHNIGVSCFTFDRCSTVLEKTCQGIGLENEMIYYFTLMLEYSSPDDQSNWILLRPLHECEAPYVSLDTANTSQVTYRLALRRWFFDPEWIVPLLSSSVGLNLLYIETVRDVEGGDLDLSRAFKQKLEQLKKFGMRREYILLAASHPHFGYRKCGGILLDGGKEGCVKVGGKELIISHQLSNRSCTEKRYPLAKLRRWKVGVMSEVKEHFLAIEHEYFPDHFNWVWLRGESTILLTMCLDQAVNEFQIRKKVKTQRVPGDPMYSLPQKVCLPLLKLTSMRPPGDDLHMSVAYAQVTLDGSETDSQASVEIEVEQDLDKDPSDHHSPPGDEIPSPNKQESSAVASRSSSSGYSAAGRQAKYMRSKIVELSAKRAGFFKQIYQQEEPFNPTYLGDAEL